MAALILSGPPGVGKTTAATLLADRAASSVHLTSDDFFRFIRSGHVDPWRPESRQQNEAVMEIVAGAAAGYASAGYFTVLDGIFIPGWFFEPVRDALRDAGHEVAYAVLRMPLAACLARVQAREGEVEVVPDAIERLWDSFADLGGLEPNVIDVEGLAPGEVADRIEGRLREGQLSV